MGKNVQELNHEMVAQEIMKHPNDLTLLVTGRSQRERTSSNVSSSQTATLTHAYPTAGPGEHLPRTNIVHARLCHLKKWPDFDGYGFDLYEIKDKKEARIGPVAHDSPAQAGGLKMNDYIIEVNRQSADQVSHSEVVDLIKQKPGACSILVVDKVAYDHFKENSIRIHSDMDNVEVINCPENGSVFTVAEPPRHVELTKKDGTYGFDLHELKNKPGHIVGSLAAGGAAANAGINEGDQLIAVNGESVVNETHDEVVRKVLSRPEGVELLLVSSDSSTTHHSNALWVETGNRDTVIMVPTSPKSDSAAPVISPNAPRPRLCCLRRWADFSGYGFNLHEQKNRPGHIIGSVDPGSPAEAAGMKKGDKVIEVNGHNVLESSHHSVVDYIKLYEDHVDLLVVDTEAENFYKENAIWVHRKMDNVHVLECPRRSSTAAEIPIPEAVAASAATTVLSTPNEDEIPLLRLCVVRKWPDYDGYGFNLHDEKGVSGHFIGNVDPGSPADLAGLKKGDKLVEVNGQSVFQDDHHQVVGRVKSNPGEVSMLVMEPNDDSYFISHDLKPHGGMKYTLITCPDRQPSEVGAVHEDTLQIRRVNESSVVELQQTHAPSIKPEEQIRFCTLKKWTTYDGYGFNLHNEKGRPGHFIGHVEPNSPAETAGVIKGDQIFEVNNGSVRSDDHNVVIQRIKMRPDEVSLLVASPAIGTHYINQDIWPHSRMSTILTLAGPETQPPPPSPTLASATTTTATVVSSEVHTSTIAPQSPSMVQPEPVIRLCHLRKWTPSTGYGFRLHDNKKKPGHFIGVIEPNSPADLAGLNKGDRVVEVNGISVLDFDHHQVVNKITTNPSEVRLLVLDEEADSFYKSQNVWPHGAMPNVSRIECPTIQPVVVHTNGYSEAATDEIQMVEHNHLYVEPERTPAYEPAMQREPSPEPVRAPTPEIARVPTPEPIRAPTPEPVRVPTPEPIRVPTPEPVRAPTPEPVRAPTPEPIRVPTPEPIRVPTPEPIRVPTPEPVRAPTPEPLHHEHEVISTAVGAAAVASVVSEVKSEPEVRYEESTHVHHHREYTHDVAPLEMNGDQHHGSVTVHEVTMTRTEEPRIHATTIAITDDDIEIAPPPPPLPEEMNGTIDVANTAPYSEQVHFIKSEELVITDSTSERSVVSEDHDRQYGTRGAAVVTTIALNGDDDRLSSHSTNGSISGASSSDVAIYEFNTGDNNDIAKVEDVEVSYVEPEPEITLVSQSYTSNEYLPPITTGRSSEVVTTHEVITRSSILDEPDNTRSSSSYSFGVPEPAESKRYSYEIAAPVVQKSYTIESHEIRAPEPIEVPRRDVTLDSEYPLYDTADAVRATVIKDDFVSLEPPPAPPPPEVKVRSSSYEIRSEAIEPPVLSTSTESSSSRIITTTTTHVVNSYNDVENGVVDVKKEVQEDVKQEVQEHVEDVSNGLEERTERVNRVVERSTVEVPPPSGFIDQINGTSRSVIASSPAQSDYNMETTTTTTTLSSSESGYTTETTTVVKTEENSGPDTSSFVSTSSSSSPVAEPSIKTKTTKTTRNYSYAKPATTTAGSFAIRSSAASSDPSDPIGGSLQDVLNRVKSRKKPAARTGNLSVKEKYELFQQL